jgi:hypothetical protein
MMRRAISPRLAMRIFENIEFRVWSSEFRYSGGGIRPEF